MNYKKISKIKGPEIKDSWFKESLNFLKLLELAINKSLLNIYQRIKFST